MLFEKPQFERLLRNYLLQVLSLATQFLNLISVSGPCRVPSKPLLTRFP